MTSKTPEEMSSVWSDAYNRRDLDGLVQLYEPSCVLTTRAGAVRTGLEEIRAHFKAQLDRVPRMTMKMRKVIRGHDIALCYGDWTAHLINPDGTPNNISGQSVEVLRRQADGTWRYVLDDPFPAAPGPG